MRQSLKFLFSKKNWEPNCWENQKSIVLLHIYILSTWSVFDLRIVINHSNMARHEKPATGSKINWKSGDKHAHGPAPPSPKAA